MTAFSKTNGDYVINGYTFKTSGITFPDGSVQASASTGSGGGSSGPVTWTSITGKPAFFSGSYADLTNKPGLFSGSYTDLTNKPTIPTVPTTLSSFTNDSGYITSVSWNQVTDKPALFSGSYADLTNKPTIPSIAGLATEAYVNTQVSNLVNAAPSTLDTLNELAVALGNDANYATTISNQLGLKANTSSLSAVATSGSYADLTNKPTIPTVPTTLSSFTNDSGYLTSVSWSQVISKPTFAPVATSGSYDDLTNKPTIPTAVSTLTNDAGYITIAETLSPFLLMGA